MKPWILLRLAALAAGAFIGGCSYDSSTYLPPPSPVTVTLIGLPDTLAAGDIAVFGVRVQDTAGNAVPQPALTITSSDSAVAVVDGSGRVRGVAGGVVTIRASALGGSTAATLVVTGGPAVFQLQHFGGALVPELVEIDTVRFSDGTSEIRDLYLDGGTLTLSGGPHPSYQTTLHYAEYAVTVDDAGQHLVLDGTHDVRDQGFVSYDARGDLSLTSLLPDLTESASAGPAGFEVLYRYSASDFTPTEAFVARTAR